MKLVPNIYDVPEVKAEKHWSFVSYKPDWFSFKLASFLFYIPHRNISIVWESFVISNYKKMYGWKAWNVRIQFIKLYF
jgi:hypothetical protein